jgi:hypothetical protein
MMAEFGGPVDCVVLPADDRQARAAWQGTTLRRGPLVRSITDLADSVAPKPSRRNR